MFVFRHRVVHIRSVSNAANRHRVRVYRITLVHRQIVGLSAQQILNVQLIELVLTKNAETHVRDPVVF